MGILRRVAEHLMEERRMQRNTSTWVYFLSLVLGIAMTVALLPACGGGGGGSSCNSPGNQEEGSEEACDAEEVNEEDFAAAQEEFDEQREDTGEPGADEEDISEFIECGFEFGCAEI
jgi:hypothetical protein